MASLVRVAFVVVVYVVLLHSSMGQQPAPTSPPSDCTNQCTSMCTQGCQSVNSDPSKCESAQSVYNGCFTQCTKDCKGSSCAHLSCEMGSCSDTCHNPCALNCCDYCTTAAKHETYDCTRTARDVKMYCMPNCMDDCIKFNCTSGSPPPMA
ncbi:hypothetical protein HU200_053551 [Digitaria exilis]|uniref:Uncharacterized protein n=1 Tax=Digitaria exilis TaxID=1010633 RepID=A0A835E7Q6_9POAL|nr:hypothetical protein HU200_053551 [Digitaria exilis]